MLDQIDQLSLVSRYSRSTLRKKHYRPISWSKIRNQITASVNAATHVKSNGYHSQHVDPCRSSQMPFSQPTIALSCKWVCRQPKYWPTNADVPNLYPVSQPKIHHLESLLNHNI